MDKKASNTVLKGSNTEITDRIKDFSRQEVPFQESKAALVNKAEAKNKSFYSLMNDVKTRELEFNMSKYDNEKDILREEMDIKRRRVEIEEEELTVKKSASSVSARKDIIQTLITQGKTAQEIGEYMNAIMNYL
jgi:hypothetical protein